MTPPPPGSATPSPDVRLLGAVLAGGAGRRFGGDKTAADVGGVPMIRRAVDALGAACDEVVVISSRPETLRGEWRVVPDLRPGLGPLAGIETALSLLSSAGGAAPSSPDDGVVVLASDLPLVGPDAVDCLVTAYRAARRGARSGSGVEAAAAARIGDPAFEPLFAVYSPACAPVVTRLLDEGRSAAQELFRAVSGVAVEVPGDVASLNVNTPNDRETAEARLRGESLQGGAR